MSPEATRRASRRQAKPMGSLRQAHTAAVSKHWYSLLRNWAGACCRACGTCTAPACCAPARGEGLLQSAAG